MKIYKVYPDTTVLLAAFFVNDFAAQWMRRLIESPHEILIGVPVARDFTQTAQRHFDLSPTRFANALKVLRQQTFLPVSHAHDLPQDLPNLPNLPNPDAAQVIACALSGHADYFVTGDPALLAAESIAGLPIRTPRALWETLFP